MVHGCLVYTERAEMTAVSRGTCTSHVRIKQRCNYTICLDIQSWLYKATVTDLESHMRQEHSESVPQRRIQTESTGLRHPSFKEEGAGKRCSECAENSDIQKQSTTSTPPFSGRLWVSPLACCYTDTATDKQLTLD